MLSLSRFRHLYAVLFFLLVASCSGGGCSGCTSCGGTTPLPGGFPKEKTIENAATVRISRPGLTFVEGNLGPIAAKLTAAPGGVLAIDIPNANLGNQNLYSSTLLNVNLAPEICPGGPDPNANPPKCQAQVGIGNAAFRIDAVKPDRVNVAANIPLVLQNTPVTATASGDVAFIGFGPVSVTIRAAYGANGSCNGPTPNVSTKNLPVAVSIPLVAETIAPRDGYTKIDVQNADINLDAIVGDDVRLCVDCGIIPDAACNYIINAGFVKNFVVDQLKSGLRSQVKTLLEGQLCTKPNPALNPACPDKTQPNAANDKCVYKSAPDKCVPLLLGTDAHVDLGGFLRSISPGTSGGLDFGLASGGAMKAFPNANADVSGHTPNGITLSMLGGVVPQPTSKCVPKPEKELAVPTGIPVPDELAPTSPDAPNAPHVGIGLASRFIDYSLYSVYNSGLLCLGVSSEQVDLLKSGLLSLLIPSIKTLTFEQADASAAITTRPQVPPTVKIGGGTDVNRDPLLSISMPKFAIDFYIWSLDRYVRAFTFQGDLTVPVNLVSQKAGIQPSIGDIKVVNGTVSNSDLLTDDPAVVAGVLQGLVGGLSKQLAGGGFSPVDISSALSTFGLGLEVSEIKRLVKDQDDFVGIFATMSKTAGAASPEADTFAKLVSKTVPADHMQLATLDRAHRPKLELELGSSLDDGTHTVEYAWWIDGGTRSMWSTDKHLVVSDDQLVLQGRHVLHVAARLAGESRTEDASPVEIPFTIDALAPIVKVEASGREAKISAWDVVSTNLVGRFSLDGKPMGDFVPMADLARVDVGSAHTIDVEVKDEEGNVQKVSQSLIRGRDDGSITAAGSGCGCSAPGDRGPSGTIAVALGLGALALVVFRRRTGKMAHGALAVLSIGAVAATSQGCGCGGSDDNGTGCGSDCNQECKPSLSFGLPGSYTSLAKSKDGSIWVSGYNDALLSEGDSSLFGDLVVGRYDLGKQLVDWQTVDGIPARAEGCAERSKDSWRSGETDSGEDVGLWTSLQVTTEDHPFVTYYDATNKRLKAAYEDGGWKTFVLREIPGGDVGRYAKSLLVGDKLVVAFLHIETGNAGKTRSKISVARAKVPTPHGPEDFTFEDAAIEEENPCRSTSCPAGQACVKTSGACTQTTGGCTPADCGAGKACVAVDGKATCVATKGAVESYPDVFGGYVSLAAGPQGLGISVYDRAHGNLVGLVEKNPGDWQRTILDGETGSRSDKTAIDTGDVGLASSLTIDTSGVWHLTYVSGLDESLRYLEVAGGKPGKSEIIDDGTGVDGKGHADGKHVVGDDSTLRVDGDLVNVYYQDATQGVLRRAIGSKTGGATHKWELRSVPQPGKFAGFFPRFVPGEDKVANWWRQTDRASKTVVGDVSILAP